MHLLHLTQDLDTGKDYGVLKAGDWLLHDRNAFECAMLAERGSAMLMNYAHQFTERPIKNVLIMRSGAIGDLLLASPAIRAFIAAHPDLSLSVCCRDDKAMLFAHTGITTVSYPLPYEIAKQFDQIISLEEVMELNPEMHATDAFAAALNVTVTDYKPSYVVTDSERALHQLGEFDGNRPKVGIQMRASVKNRDYPFHLWLDVMWGLQERGWRVYLFGTPGQIPPLPPGFKGKRVFDCSNLNYTFRDTAAALSHCDAFIGVDSALLHLCHALDIPAIGLYGAFDWRTRCGKAPKTYALTGAGDCAPCSWHSRLGQHFPPMPCRQKQECSVLASIKPERIISKVDQFRSPHA